MGEASRYGPNICQERVRVYNELGFVPTERVLTKKSSLPSVPQV